MSPRRSPGFSSSYKSLASGKAIHPVHKEGKARKSCKKYAPRNYNGHVFPKAQLRQLAYKAGFARVRGTEGDENAYDYMDEKMFMVMEKALHDAEAIADVAHAMTIKERHVAMALERHGVIGIASDEARRQIAQAKHHKKTVKKSK